MKLTNYIWLFNTQLILVDCNEAVLSLKEMTREQLKGCHLRTIFAEVKRHNLMKLFERFLKDGQSFSREIAFKTSKKEEILLAVNVFKLGNGFTMIGKEKDKSSISEELASNYRLNMDLIAKNSPDIFMLLDREGTILYTNRVLDGYTIDQVIGSSAYDYQNAEESKIMKRSIEKVLQTKKPERYEISSSYFKDEILYFDSRVAPVMKDGEIAALAVITRNKTAIKKTMQDAQTVKNKYLELLLHTGTVDFIQDNNLIYTYIFNPNPAFREKDVLGKTDDELLQDGDNVQTLKEIKLQVLKTGEPIRKDVQAFINGATFYYDLMLNPIFNSRGEIAGLRGISYDITKYKETIFKIEKAELEGKKAMIEGEEKERQRIAADLHDAINPLLSTTKLTLESLKGILKQAGGEAARKIDNAVELLNKSMDETKIIVHNLSPPVLKDFGLRLALSELCEKIAETGDLKVVFDTYGLKQRFDEKLEKNLFRIAQELLHNVIKHAAASLVELQLIQHKGSILLMITDDGKGMNQIRNTNFKEGTGFKNIKNRIAAFEGKIEVDSTIGKGTIITIELPI